MAGNNGTIYYPFYMNLTENQRLLYRKVVAAIARADTALAPSGTFYPKDVDAVMTAIHYDRPDLPWFKGSYSTSYRQNTEVVTEIRPSYNDLARCLADTERRMNQAVQKYLSGLEKKTAEQRERIVHDRLVQNVSYVKGPNNQNAYGALVDGEAVCAGYARAFQLLMQKCGIPCYYCSGKASGNSGGWGAHGWNLIQLGGDFYNVDITWDDCYDTKPGSQIGYSYYNCTDREMAKTHVREACCRFLPACNGTKYSFQSVNGISAELERVYQDGVSVRTAIRTEAEFKSLIRAAVQRRKSNTFTLSFPLFGKKNYGMVKDWTGDALAEARLGRSYAYSLRSTDYHTDWYRIEISVTIK